MKSKHEKLISNTTRREKKKRGYLQLNIKKT
jgi:hypothetical protein